METDQEKGQQEAADRIEKLRAALSALNYARDIMSIMNRIDAFDEYKRFSEVAGRLYTAGDDCIRQAGYLIQEGMGAYPNDVPF